MKIRDTAYNVKAKPEIFETAFFEGTKTNDNLALNFYVVEIGKLKVESGQLIACDPLVLQDAPPFTQVFPKGEFPVQLSIAQRKGDERVAFSRILISDKPPVKWEFALLEGQTPLPIEGETTYGYGVDGGTGLFVDEKSRMAFNDLQKRDESIWDKVFIDELGRNHRPTWDYLLYIFGAYNLALFSTGFGDGHYSTYIGRDDEGNPCRLLTDFNLVSWWTKS